MKRGPLKRRGPGAPRSALGAVRLWVRCTEAERAAWQRAADADGRTLQQWLKRVGNVAAREEPSS